MMHVLRTAKVWALVAAVLGLGLPADAQQRSARPSTAPPAAVRRRRRRSIAMWSARRCRRPSPGTTLVDLTLEAGDGDGAREEPRSEGGADDAADRRLPVAVGARGVQPETDRHLRLQQPVAAEQQLGLDPTLLSVNTINQNFNTSMNQTLPWYGATLQRDLQQQPGGDELAADAAKSGVQHRRSRRTSRCRCWPGSRSTTRATR